MAKKTDKRKCDLHIHTTYSDGLKDPEFIIEEAIKNNLFAIAICDHDTVEGVVKCIEIVKQKGLENKIEIIPGIELDFEFAHNEKTDILRHEIYEGHMLGYLIDYKNEEFINKLSKIRNEKQKTFDKQFEKLNSVLRSEKKAELSYDDILNQDKLHYRNLSKMHFAKALVEKKYCSSISEAFETLLGRGCPAYVKGPKMKFEDVLDLIESAKGIPVLAHLNKLILDYSAEEGEYIATSILKNKRVMGLEAKYPYHQMTKKINDVPINKLDEKIKNKLMKDFIEFGIRLANYCNKITTGGSDYHGRPDGIKIGEFSVPYKVVDILKNIQKKEWQV